jgi:hypothetical protein
MVREVEVPNFSELLLLLLRDFYMSFGNQSGARTISTYLLTMA